MINSDIAMSKILEGLYAGGILSREHWNVLKPMFDKKNYSVAFDYLNSNCNNMSQDCFSALFFVLSSIDLVSFSF